MRKVLDEDKTAWVTARPLVGPFREIHADINHYADFAPYTDLLRIRRGERVLFITGVFVRQHARGQRLGIKLLDELVAETDATREILIAQGFADAPDGPSVGLEMYYHKAGFRRCGTTIEGHALMQRWRDGAAPGETDGKRVDLPHAPAA